MAIIKYSDFVAESIEDGNVAEYLNRAYPLISLDSPSDYARQEKLYDDELAEESGSSIPTTPNIARFADRIAAKRFTKRKIEVPKEALVFFHNMTSNNYHIQVRYEIAKFFAKYSNEFDQYAAYFDGYKKLTEKRGFPDENSPYLIMSEIMLSLIAIIFGNNVARQINACL